MASLERHVTTTLIATRTRYAAPSILLGQVAQVSSADVVVTPFAMQAATAVALVEALIDAGADPCTETRQGSPLHCAAAAGHAAIVSLLLESGADPGASNHEVCISVG